MRRFQNISALAVELPDSLLLPAQIVEFDHVPHDVALLAASGVLLELDEETEPEAVEPLKGAKK